MPSSVVSRRGCSGGAGGRAERNGRSRRRSAAAAAPADAVDDVEAARFGLRHRAGQRRHQRRVEPRHRLGRRDGARLLVGTRAATSIGAVSVSVTVTSVALVLAWLEEAAEAPASSFRRPRRSGSAGLRTGTVPTSVMRFVSRTSFWAIAV
ncbi:MAG: hypothetical protein MZV64_13655 [Ignavibacteriales bacterium]|nr:hypothetical protein [Ignavibacteriales bacterium]